MHHHAQPAPRFRCIDKAVRVRAIQAAFQTVKHHQTRLMARGLRIFAPRQIDKVAVGQFKALPVRCELHLTADKARQHGLQMTIADTAHRHEVGAALGVDVEIVVGSFSHVYAMFTR